MKHLDLFSGIGGFALAAQWAGIETVGFCEIEEFPRKVLQKNFPGVKIHHDIRELDGSEYEGVDIITGGYPCQPFSLAGKRRGKKDDSHLWPEMLRVIAQAKPTWVVCENVAGHITLGLDKVLFDLEGEGYTLQSFAIPACGVDAPHKRERVWIVANSTRSDDRGSNTSSVEGQKQEFGKGGCRGSNTMADTKSEQGRGVFEPGALKTTSYGGNGRSETGAWATEPGMGRVANGIPGRVDRLKGLGNAIVPQVAYEILRCIVIDNNQKREI